MPNPPEKRAAPLGLVALSVPAAVCFAGWSVDAAVRYSTGGYQASLIAALALVAGSFAAIVPAVVLIGRLTKNPSERRWPGYLVFERFVVGIVAGVAHGYIFRISPMITPEVVPARAVPPNKQLQRTVMDKVPRH